MSSENFFRTPEEELARLNKELEETRAVLREAVARLSQIERHVKRAFGIQSTPKVAPPKSKEPGSEKPSISSEEALALFRDLTDLSRDRGIATVEERLGHMSIADLKLMSHELGVPLSKPTRNSLHTGIRGRVRESEMLSRNQNVTIPLSGKVVDAESEGTDEPVARQDPEE